MPRRNFFLNHWFHQYPLYSLLCSFSLCLSLSCSPSASLSLCLCLSLPLSLCSSHWLHLTLCLPLTDSICLSLSPSLTPSLSLSPSHWLHLSLCLPLTDSISLSLCLPLTNSVSISQESRWSSTPFTWRVPTTTCWSPRTGASRSQWPGSQAQCCLTPSRRVCLETSQPSFGLYQTFPFPMRASILHFQVLCSLMFFGSNRTL